MIDDTGNVVPGYVNYMEAWIVKIDPAGKILWQKLFGSKGYDQALSIRNTPDGGYVFAGVTNSTDGEFASQKHGVYDGWVVKLDSAGNKQWQTLLGGSDNDWIMSIRPTSDNGYIVAGYTNSSDIPNAGIYHGKTDIYIAKLNSTGRVVWQKVFGGSKYDFGSSIIPASDGGYILTGYTESDDIPGANKNHGNYDILVMKLDNSGNPQWTKLIGGKNYELTAFDNVIQPTTDGGYILTGQTSSSANGDAGITHGSADVWVVKLDASGTIQWQNLLGGTGYDDGTAIQQTPHGDYILVGRTTSDNSGDVGQNNGNWDIWVAKLDPAGKLLWQDAVGGSAYDQCTAIQPTPDEGFILAAYTESSNSGNVGTNHGHQDAWIVKLKPRLVVDVLDSDTHSWVPNTTVLLHDVAHNEDQNLTALINGRVVFTGSGVSDQFRFNTTSKYTVRATADKYRDGVTVNVVFAQDGQRVILNLTAFDRPAIEKTFSITSIYYNPFNEPDSRPQLNAEGQVVNDELKSAGWGDPVFYHKDLDVTSVDLGFNSGGLAENTFHWHTGHGWYNPNDPDPSSSGITLLRRDGTHYQLSPGDVAGRWNQKNKWVVFDVCLALGDPLWNNALGTTHGIFGFTTGESGNTNLPKRFFYYAKQEQLPLALAWRNATIDTYHSIQAPDYINDPKKSIPIGAAVRFDNEPQYTNDHLPGYGGIEPDEYSNDNNYVYVPWNCVREG
ncbi:MAG: hypothetical protein Q7T80_05015 [Methanoregula sp.]|nr:hypothetical protein [Methanoregula sp.]